MTGASVRWIDFIFPRRCALCDCVLGRKEQMLCARCASERLPVRRGECVQMEHALFEFAAAPFLYRGPVRDSVLRMKYGGRAEYARFFAEMILEAAGAPVAAWGPQAVIPVPVHPERLSGRGYNQAEEIARHIARRMRLPMITDAVRRVHRTRPQKELTAQERKNNLRGAFGATGRRVPERILVVEKNKRIMIQACVAISKGFLGIIKSIGERRTGVLSPVLTFQTV